MEKKGVYFSISMLFLVLFLLPVNVLAQNNPGKSILGGLENDILKVVENILNYRMPAEFGQIGGQPMIMVTMVFLIFLAIFLAVTKQIPPFKTGAETHNGPATLFSVGLAAAITYITPIVPIIANVLKGIAGLFALALIVIAFIFIYYTVKGGFHQSRASTAGIVAESASARAKENEAKIVEEKSRRNFDYEKKLLELEENLIIKTRQDMTDMMGKTRDIATQLKDILRALAQLSSIRDEGIRAQEIKRLNAALSNCLGEATKKDSCTVFALRNNLGYAEAYAKSLQIKGKTTAAELRNELQKLKTAAGGGKYTLQPMEVHLPDKMASLSANALSLVESIKTNFEKELADENKVVAQIKAAIGHLHNNQFPEATQALNDALQKEVNETSILAGTEGYLNRLIDVNNNMIKLVNELKTKGFHL